jgi:hypothetical protein
VRRLNEEEIVSKLKGNTLRVYWGLLSSEDGVVGVREIQRDLGFSSPALAAYHLNKLVDFGLAVNDRGDYRLVREVKVGVLKQYIKLGGFLLPRYVLYASMFSTFLVYLVLRFDEVSFYSKYGLVVSLIAAGVSWFETVKIWQQKP